VYSVVALFVLFPEDSEVSPEFPSPLAAVTEASLAAGHLLARAALEAFAAASRGEREVSYELLDLDPHELAETDPLRLAYICEKLRQLLELLKGHTPDAPWDAVQRVVSERVGSILQATCSPSW